MSTSRSASPAPTATGLVIALTGLAHFVVPGAFRELTRLPFPDDTDAWVRRDGVVETVIGAAIAHPRTRRPGWVGLAGYVVALGVASIVNNQ